MPTQKEKLLAYQTVLHRIQMYADVTMDHERLGKLIRKISNWSYAHRQGNGQLTDRQQNRLINAAFEKLKEIE